MTRPSPRTLSMAAPVSPSATHLVHRPLALDRATITGGFWAERQALNAEASLPSNIANLETDGALDNLRLAAGESGRDYREPVFMDAAVHKTLDAAVWELARRPDPDLETWVEKVVEILERAQGADGYLNSYVQVVRPDLRYANLRHSHEIYCGAILMSAAVAAQRTGLLVADRMMAIATRFADHVVDEFLGARPELDGHEGAEFSFIEFARHTGERRYLDLATQFILGRGQNRVDPGGRRRYFQDHESVLHASTEVGHAVRAMYLESGVVDLYLETGDRRLLDASVARWEDMVATKTYLTGGLGSRHSEEAFGDAWELPPDRAYAETCASFAAIFWNHRLLLATGDSRYADFIENSLFNIMAASTSRDGQHFFYVNPLQRRTDHVESDDEGRRHAWFYCPCCPPNITRLFASLGAYLSTAADDTLYLNQFASSTVRADVDGELAVSVETNYPWSGRIAITVDDAPTEPRGIAIRRPSWAREVRVAIDGTASAADTDDSGYILLRRAWTVGQVIEVDIDLETRTVVADDRVDAIRGAAALKRGPLVYCFEDVDQPDGADTARLRLMADSHPRPREVDDRALGRVVVVDVDAEHVDHGPVPATPYHDLGDAEPPRTRPVRATAVPYFAWDNRDGRGMKVWLPLAGSADGRGAAASTTTQPPYTD